MEPARQFLIVDDNSDDAEALRRELNRQGQDRGIDVASSLHEAKRKIRSGRYDLVFLDLGLPDSQGIDGVIDLQATAPEIPLVVVSGNEDKQSALRAMMIGAEDYIKKEPGAFVSLERAAQFAIERHRRKRQLYQDVDGMRLSLDDAMLQAQTDPLTGLPNRRGLQRHLERLDRYRLKQPLIVALADLDRFKSINDSFGHDVGDLILLEFVARLQQCLGHEDFAARVGGDEFVLVMAGSTRAQAEAKGAKLMALMAATPAVAGGRAIAFSASVAMAELEPPFSKLDQILGRNHEMMAAAKEGGRARVRCAWLTEGEEPAQEAPAAPEPAFDFSAAMHPDEQAKDGELFQFLRPIVSLPDGGVLGGHVSFGMGSESHPLRTPAFGRARISGKLGHLTLDMMRRAAHWRLGQPAGTLLHVDMEAEALKPWMVGEMIGVFPKEDERRTTCLFFATDFVTKVGADVLMPIRLLRKAGFEIGVRGLGDGATVLEHILMMEPDWVRLDMKLTANISRFAEKARRLERLVGALWLMEAATLAEEMTVPEDMEFLAAVGCKLAYGAVSRQALVPAA